MGKGGSKSKSSSSAARTALRITKLVRPHWKTLALAMVAAVGETLADVLQPWPIKIVVDTVVQSKRLPAWLDAFSAFVGSDKYGTLNLAVLAVAVIAVLDGVASYFDKYLTTRVAQWVGHDLRMGVYQHI